MNWLLDSYRVNQLATFVASLVRPAGQSQLCLIFGCQRSGTTMVGDLLGRSPRVKNYGEGDAKYFEWKGAPRLRPCAQVIERMAQERSCFVLIKPLCESQNATEILDVFPLARGVWVFRDFRNCIKSHLHYYKPFHGPSEYIQPLLAGDENSWMAQNLDQATMEFVQSFRTAELDAPDRYGLYWLARNSCFLRLAEDERIRLVNYEDILQAPNQQTGELFSFFGIPFRPRYASIVRPPSNAGNADLPIKADIHKACLSLMHRLVHHCQKQVSLTASAAQRASAHRGLGTHR